MAEVSGYTEPLLLLLLFLSLLLFGFDVPLVLVEWGHDISWPCSIQVSGWEEVSVVPVVPDVSIVDELEVWDEQFEIHLAFLSI
ncbi:hypothetical protein [Prolixibacter denitrificans]|uniref:Uncharacterized protein n=1 Tax=Prolixibacter denitrificans TaxID=1541063 RepID=A0A2P8CFK8_9BACT|nr:hypothetical protein [Prolixibacter denitrificans]PSK83744.1 hypothetical protein CLV93_103159 [Prolixibacter denitrificans]GET23288.1 hypothetical protein JCM18694_35340 [Prolixibacter denitrificans]